MFDWNGFTLLLYIIMRMSGFIMFHPVFGRNGIPRMFKAGMIVFLALSAYYSYGGTAVIPGTFLEFVVRLLGELGAGLAVAIVSRFFFYIPEQAGEVIDTQMGLSMAKIYDAGAHASLTTSASMLNILMMLLFFAANGHITLLRIMLTSGEIIPFGAASFAWGQAVSSRVVELFAECALLAVKLSMPILAAELLGQVGMGVLMKVIPQINVFAINIELKVLIGLTMLMLLIAPISDFLLSIENTMLTELRQLLTQMAGG